MHDVDDTKAKRVFEYYRHITTLSSASIVLLATFFSKDIKSLKYLSLINIAIIGFLISIIGAMASYTIDMAIVNRGSMDKASPSEEHISGFGLFLTWSGFLAGMISIGIFSIRNYS